MNCCNAYGECNQGWNCPIRQAKEDPLDIKTTQVFEQLGDLLIILIGVVTTLVFLVASVVGIYFWRLA